MRGCGTRGRWGLLCNRSEVKLHRCSLLRCPATKRGCLMHMGLASWAVPPRGTPVCTMCVHMCGMGVDGRSMRWKATVVWALVPLQHSHARPMHGCGMGRACVQANGRLRRVRFTTWLCGCTIAARLCLVKCACAVRERMSEA